MFDASQKLDGWARIARAVLVVAVGLGLALLLVIGLRIHDGLSGLKGEAHDNLFWNISQLEVDVVGLGEGMRLATLQPAYPLKDLRKRFDLFYSRAQNAIGGRGFSNPALDDLPAAYAALLSAYVARETPLIDGPDSTLRENLPAMTDRLDALRASLRKISIQMIDALARQSDEKRASISALVQMMGLAMLATVLMLGGLLAVAAWLNRAVLRQMRASRQVSERLSATINNALDAIIVADDQGRIIEYNPSAETTFGHSKAEVLGQAFIPLLLPPGPQGEGAAGLQTMPSGRLQTTALHRSGREFPVELAISSSTSDDGRIHIAFARDISDRVAAETNLTEARDRAVAAGRAKTEFIGVMSHEMRTPLNGVIASLEIASGMTRDAELLRFIGLAQNSAQLLLRHANDVLDISRLERGGLQMTPEDFDFDQHILGLVENVRPLCDEKGIFLTYRMTGEKPFVQGDPFRVGQIVQNFLSNAIKFVQRGGITVEAEVSECHGTQRIIEVRVIDTGPGIDPVDQARIFDDFVMLDPSFGRTGEGAGLGLSICRRLAAALAGEIGVESAPGEGSCFWLRLPFELGRRPQAAEPHQDRAPMPAMEVLVVEDNATNRAVMGELLRRLGQRVTFAFDGQQGLTAAARRFDLILMDVSMPVMDGLTATRLIRREGASKSSRIVAVTAHSMPEDLDHIRAAGMDDVLTKPISGANLIRVLSGGAPLGGPLDDERIAELRAAIGSDGLARLAEKFLADGQRLVSQLLSDAEAERMTAHCHEMAGMASVLGAEKLARLCRRAEEMARQGQLADVRHVLRRDLVGIWEETVNFIRPLSNQT